MKAPRGQNFLYQAAWQQRVAAAVGAAEAVLEIGGGPGGLSSLLAASAQRLWVVENDRRLAEGLRARFAGQSQVEVIEADILTIDLRTIAQGRKLRVAGNLPYYITSPILLHLFQHAEAVGDAFLMMQREVAERITARPGGSDFGLLSATTQFYSRPQRLFDLPPGAFQPAPKVVSSLVRLEFAPQAETLEVEPEAFLRFLRRAFAQKRKQLGKHLGVRLAECGLRPDARAEQLSLEQLAEVYRRLPVE